jgi:hypothetical protein
MILPRGNGAIHIPLHISLARSKLAKKCLPPMRAKLRAGRVAALQAPLRSIARLAALSLAAPASVIEVGHRANFVIIWSEVNGTIGGTIVSKYREIDVRGTRAHSLTYTVSARIHDPYHRTTIFICRHGLSINFQIETG